ncbi:MAG: EpsG family protein [Winogradskyella sp.]
MDYFYFYTLLVAIVFIFHKNFAKWLSILGGIFFLLYLPASGFYSPDYFGYEQAYESAFVVPEYPWISSDARIDAEIFYLRYTAFFKIITGLSYPYFLVINFVICVLLSYLTLKRFNTFVKDTFWVMFFPILFPILFFHLIRSSISLFLLFLGFMMLVNAKNYKSIIFALIVTFIGFNFHSQYILIAVLFSIAFFLLRFKSVKDYSYNLRLVFVFSAILVVVLVALRSFVEELSTLVSVISTSDLATSKLGYLETEDSRGFRITSVLSVFVYPYMIYQLIKNTYWNPRPLILNEKHTERVFLFMLFAVVFFTAAINIAYFDSTHLSSRLGRFSDYLCMAVLVPLYLKICIGNKTESIIVLVVAVIAPFLYASIYQDYYNSFQWNIF